MDKQKLLKLTAMVSITGTIAFFSYKFGKRLYLDYKEYKEGLDGSIEAVDIVKEAAKAKAKAMVEEASEDRSDTFKELHEEDSNEEEEDPYFDYYTEDSNIEELMELRHDPNSVEALEQFKQMKLAEFDSVSSARTALMDLFEIPYEPSCELDAELGNNLINQREDFFGVGSIHNEAITVADLLLYFAEKLTFEVDGDVVSWVSTFLNNIGYFNISGRKSSIYATISNLQKHFLVFDGRWGIFGLGEEKYFEISKENDGETPYIRQFFKCLDIHYGLD